MVITTTDTAVKIKYGKRSFTHPINTVSYILSEDSNGLTLFRNNERIGTSAIEDVLVNGVNIDMDNAHEHLAPLFNSLNSGNNNNAGEGGEDSPMCSTCPQHTYAQDSTALPADAAIGDKYVVTADGTKDGKIKEVYEWNGIFWTQTAKDGNIMVEADNQAQAIYPAQYTSVIGSMAIADILPNSDSTPKECELQGIYKIVKLQECDDYHIRRISYIADKHPLRLDGNLTSGKASISIQSNVSQEDIKDPFDLYIKDCTIGHMSMYSVFNNIYLDNVKVVSDTEEYPFEFYGPSYTGDAVFKNMFLNIAQYSSQQQRENPLNMSFENCYFHNGTNHGSINLQLSEPEATKLPVNLSFKNTVLDCYNIMINRSTINEINFENSFFNEYCTSIHISNTDFKSQEKCDEIFMKIYNNKFAERTIPEEFSYRIYFESNDFTPSSDILDLFRARGVEVDGI